jgi:hypothetical protein
MSRSPLAALVFSLMAFFSTAAQAVSAPSSRTGVIGMAEGNPAAIACPSNKFLAGFALSYKTSMSGLTPYCVDMAVDGAWSGGAQVFLDIMMSNAGGGSRLDIFCPRDSYVFAVKGLSHVYGIHAIVQLTLNCKNLKTGAQIGIATSNPDGVSVTEWPVAQCPDIAVADGVFGFIHDAEIIQFGLSCHSWKPAVALGRTNIAPKPSIVEPREGATYPPQTPLRVRIVPAKDAKDTTYRIEIQVQANFDWRDVTTVATPAGVAQSAQGYRGWGGKPGVPVTAMTAIAGTYRMRARGTAPQMGQPGEWVQFKIDGQPGPQVDVMDQAKPAPGKAGDAAQSAASRMTGQSSTLNALGTAPAVAVPNKADAASLNPQPLPPKTSPGAMTLNSQSLAPRTLSGAGALNSQALAPKTPASAAMLNAQPLPQGGLQQAPSSLR